VASNEPAGSDAVANGEAVSTGNLTLNLLAERDGGGPNGRVYTITVQCSDAKNNVSSSTVNVVVPHDLGR
jgi:hypothetical protein